jgi:uncharacterized lipoprotein
MSEVSKYYGRKAARTITVDDGSLAQVIADAGEDSDVSFDWQQQGEIHEAITERIRDHVAEVATDEFQRAIEECESDD